MCHLGYVYCIWLSEFVNDANWKSISTEVVPIFVAAGLAGFCLGAFIGQRMVLVIHYIGSDLIVSFHTDCKDKIFCK